MSNAALLTRPTTDRAFERMYRRHVHDVYRYVLAVLRNPADAEDATQATFLSAYRAFQRGDRPDLPRNWLLKIAHNECRQRFRMLARRPKEVVWDERVAAPAADESIPTAGELREALGHLSFNQRSALVMRELEGRSYGEIGQILDLSVSAVETLIFRARRALREQLEGGLTCGEAEATLSKRLDGTLGPAEQRALRAHLRECRECAVLERKQRAQRAALKRLGVIQLPPSLAGFFGGGSAGTVGGVVAGSGFAAKAAAVVAAGAIAGGVGHEAVEAVAANEPPPSPLPALKQVPRSFPAAYGGNSTVWHGHRANGAHDHVSAGSAPGFEMTVRGAVRNALSKPRAGAPASPESGSGATAASPAAGQPVGVTPPSPSPLSPPAPLQQAVETAKEVTKVVPQPPLPPVEPPPLPPVEPPVKLPPLPPPPPLPPLPPPPPLP
jgi:RNA polymerase sigma factor (sigma-70 family)